MPLAVTFPLSRRFRDLHPLEYVRAGRTKSSDRFNEPTLIGVASTSEEIAALEIKAQHWVDHYGGQQTLDL